ncbi:MAG: extracellular solute-binding protein [Clostridia bacterium]|nr:extracellular solute-binding protein [Clostridia bacterium]
MKKRSLLTVLAALLLASCAADDPTQAAVSTAPVTEHTQLQTEASDGGRSQMQDGLPVDLDFDGRSFGIYVYEEAAKYTIGLEDAAGDIVNDAVIARNIAVEERLNITLSQFSQPNGSINTVSSLLMAGDPAYDLFIAYQYEMAPLISRGGLYNLYHLDNIDFSQPWWWENYMQQLQLGGESRFFAVGDYFIRALMYAHTVYYNKAMYAEYADNADGLYETVLDGTWTFERMSAISRDVWSDLNNNGRTDADDILGYVTYKTTGTVDPFVYSSDIPFSERSDDGTVTLSLQQDDAVTLAERLSEFFWQTGSFHATESSTDATRIFTEGRSMFWCAHLSGAKYLRDMKDDFGMIPYPKFDEEQKQYRSLVHDAASIGAVSASSGNLDMTGAILEAMCAETYRSVTPVWYETATKIKYSRDDLSSQMIDLIHDTITTNFIYAYNYALNGVGMVYRDLVTKQSKDYVSAVEKIRRGAEKKLDELYEAFNENN